MSTEKQLFVEIDNHLLNDEAPSEYLEQLFVDKRVHCYPFDLLFKLKQTEQSPQHHPEGSVWNHTLLVVDEAAKTKDKCNDKRVFMWAALLHDIGKPDTTRIRKGKITSYDHDKVGSKLAGEFLSQLTDDHRFIEAVVALVRWHMQILFVAKDLTLADVKTMKQQVDIKEIALLGLCDRLGRLNANRFQEEENIKMFLQKCECK
ncbi:MAG: HDIG domain-containing protein [Oscillospiraceae bacterium]|nr:HDIG domain-containing protein [Oscillospiraceae bacterium]